MTNGFKRFKRAFLAGCGFLFGLIVVIELATGTLGHGHRPSDGWSELMVLGAVLVGLGYDVWDTRRLGT